MRNIAKIESAEPIIFGVLKLVWNDGYEGVVDLRPLLADGEIFEFLRRSPARFMDVRREHHGHYVYWIDDEGDEIEVGADSLRRDAEKQAELHRLIAG